MRFRFALLPAKQSFCLGFVMHGHGNQRPGLVARCIFVLIVLVGIATIVVGVIALRRESEPIRGSQALPGQVAEKMDQILKAAP